LLGSTAGSTLEINIGDSTACISHSNIPNWRIIVAATSRDKGVKLVTQNSGKPGRPLAQTYTLTEERVNDDRTRFTPSDGRRACDSMDYHRQRMAGFEEKALWNPEVPRQREYELFRKAEDNNWRCQRDHYWSVGDDPYGREVLGENDERVACYPRRTIEGEPVHGYPVIGKDAGPPTTFFREWERDGVIKRSFKKKLYKDFA
jgi:hypothetical protein